MLRRLLLFSLLIGLAPSAGAEVVFQPLQGTFEFSELSVSCPSQPIGCTTCVNDAVAPGDHRLIVVLGTTAPATETTGTAEGVLRPFIEVDGVVLSPALFPCSSFVRSGIRWSDLPLARSCAGTPPHATFEIGDQISRTESGDGELIFDIPSSEASEIAFRISVCSQLAYWGAGCEVGGSVTKAFRLVMPGPIEALAVAGGDVAPVARPDSRFEIDFASGPGGVLSVSRVDGEVPDAPAVPHLNGYWDVHSDMPAGSFAAEIRLGFDPLEFSGGTTPPSMVIGHYDPIRGDWFALPTQVDPSERRATATIDRAGKFVLLASGAVPTETSTFGALKARF